MERTRAMMIKYLPPTLLAHYNQLGRMAARFQPDREKLEEFRERLLGAIEAAYELGMSDGAARMGAQLNADNEIAHMLADATRPVCLVAGDEVEVINYYMPSQITGVIRTNSDDGTLFVDASKVGSADKPEPKQPEPPKAMQHGSMTYTAGSWLQVTTKDGSRYQGSLNWDSSENRWSVGGVFIDESDTVFRVLKEDGDRA